jgi:hypothetical protein
MMNKLLLLLLLTVSILFAGCKKDLILTDSGARLNFSADTIQFDTVFTTFGSATKYFTVYNHNSGTVKISSISLAGGSASAFKINADGFQGPQIKDIEIRASDSIFIFVQVLIDPAKQDAPLLILDSLIFETNGNIQNVKLAAWGQDVHLIKDSLLTTQSWLNDKPYLIFDIALVDSFSTLTIEEGTKIFLHKNALLIVEGKIIVNGTLINPVIFRGDRLDKLGTTPPVPYDKLPNQWNRILLTNSSTGNKFNYAEIRNGAIGLQVGVLDYPGTASIELTNCKFENHSSAGILAINSKIDATNCLLDNCGSFLFGCWNGGEYNFIQCTFANYFQYGQNSGVALDLQNYYVMENDTTSEKKYYYGDLKSANFENSIIFGDAADQVYLFVNDKYNFNYVFNHCLIKGTTAHLNVADQTKFIGTIISNKYDPGFRLIDLDKMAFDFQLTKSSMARDAGDTTIAKLCPADYFGRTRLSDYAPDLGAFEFIDPSKSK